MEEIDLIKSRGRTGLPISFLQKSNVQILNRLFKNVKRLIKLRSSFKKAKNSSLCKEMTLKTLRAIDLSH